MSSNTTPSVETQPKNNTVIAVLTIAYLIALCLPAMISHGKGGGYWGGGGTQTMFGIQCLLIVPQLMFSFPIAAFVMAPWWANPLFFAGLKYLYQHRPLAAFNCGLVASLLALSTPLFCMGKNDSLGPGYFVWLGCMIGLAVRSLTAIAPKSENADFGTEMP